MVMMNPFGVLKKFQKAMRALTMVCRQLAFGGGSCCCGRLEVVDCACSWILLPLCFSSSRTVSAVLKGLVRVGCVPWRRSSFRSGARPIAVPAACQAPSSTVELRTVYEADLTRPTMLSRRMGGDPTMLAGFVVGGVVDGGAVLQCPGVMYRRFAIGGRWCSSGEMKMRMKELR